MVDAVSTVVGIFKTLNAQLNQAKQTDEALGELSAHAEEIVGILEQGRGRIVDTNAVADLQTAGRELQEFLGKYMQYKQGGIKGAVGAFKNFYRAGRNKETIDDISRRIDEALTRLNLWTNVSMSAKVCDLGGDIERLLQKQDDESDVSKRRHEEVQAMLQKLLQASPGATRKLGLTDVFEWDPIPLKEWVEKHGGDEEDDERERSLLATGAFAKTYRMKGRLHGEMSGLRVAVKDIAIHEVRSRLKCPVEKVDAMVKTEVEALKRLTHKHVIAFVGQFSEGEKKERHEYIVMELASGGTLADLVKEPPVDPEKAVLLLLQLAKALTYIHDQGVLHRDIKANNVLLDASGAVKLADFGLSTLGNGTASLISARDTPAGHEFYRSPEMYEVGGAYAAPNDVWAFGCVLLEVVLGKLIDQEIYQRGNRRREELLQEVSQRHAFLGQLARKILVLDPQQRLSAFRVLQELDEYRKKRGLEAEKLKANANANTHFTFESFGVTGAHMAGVVEHIRVQRQDHAGADGNAGIGMAFAADEEGKNYIHALDPQGTAYACGKLDPGDLLLAVDEQSVQGLNIPTIVAKIKGPIDSFVTLSIIKGDGKP
mmetsp:Transcript_40536/g.94846  ORF Transcript_40536/g.94846 Transcript_40536/m.94846 type:complete len:600 (+) Transcript_40536:190-1989(+)